MGVESWLRPDLDSASEEELAVEGNLKLAALKNLLERMGFFEESDFLSQGERLTVPPFFSDDKDAEDRVNLSSLVIFLSGSQLMYESVKTHSLVVNRDSGGYGLKPNDLLVQCLGTENALYDGTRVHLILKSYGEKKGAVFEHFQDSESGTVRIGLPPNLHEDLAVAFGEEAVVGLEFQPTTGEEFNQGTIAFLILTKPPSR